MATQHRQVFKCGMCGNIVEVLHASVGELVCCGQQMNALVENTVDAAKEKHLPVIEKIPGGYKVKVGAVAHPMEEKHYIEWIGLIADDVSHIAFLKPGTSAEATFLVDAKSVVAREFCNLHGLWRS
jgi:superoxide reductase